MTKIQWTNHTWNPIVGCSKVSEGCKNCYAEKMAHRLSHIVKKNNEDGFITYKGVTQYPPGMDHGKWNGLTYLDKSALDKPLHWKKPSMIFVCSMGDLFHESISLEQTDKVFNTMWNAPQHIYQILTKRPQRMKEYFDYLDECDAEMGEPMWSEKPNPNLWLGVTAENQEMADKRIPILLQIPAAKRFVSIEPCLEKIDIKGYLEHIRYLDWVIVGCESGPKRRPCKIEWVRSIVQQCKAAGVPVFVKQLSIDGKVSHDIADWPEDLRVREFPK